MIFLNMIGFFKVKHQANSFSADFIFYVLFFWIIMDLAFNIQPLEIALII